MLRIDTPEYEFFNSYTNTFTRVKPYTLTLEHSLVSISKWESRWKKPFLDKKNEKDFEEIKDYIRCMTITQNVPPIVYDVIMNESEILDQIRDYIEDPMTATTFRNGKEGMPSHSRKIITSEVVYSWMAQYNIPVEFQKWHFNRLISLIRVCNANNTPPEKMSPEEVMRQNARLNAQRRAKYNTKG